MLNRFQIQNQKDLISKIDESIVLLKIGLQYKNYISVSGGKDSLVLLHIATTISKNLNVLMIHNEFEDDEVIDLAKKIYPNITIKIPNPTFSELIKKYNYPTKKRRWCTYWMREKYSNFRLSKIVFLGIRAAESKARKKKGPIWKYNNKIFIAPLYYFSEIDIWEYSQINNISQWSGYYRGFDRFGCSICPFNSTSHRLKRET